MNSSGTARLGLATDAMPTGWLVEVHECRAQSRPDGGTLVLEIRVTTSPTALAARGSMFAARRLCQFDCPDDRG